MFKLRSLAAFALIAFASAAAAQVYECTSSTGVKQYAQFCPPGTVQERLVTGRGDAAASSPSAPKSLEVQDAEYRLRLREQQERDAKAAEDKARADIKADNCEDARAALKGLEEGQRMQRFDPNTGERVFYSDGDREEALARQRAAVAKYCN